MSSDVTAITPAFSKCNLEKIRRWHDSWNQSQSIAKQGASQLTAIPWWHHVIIISKCKQHDEALWGKLPSIEQIERELGLETSEEGSSEAWGLRYEC